MIRNPACIDALEARIATNVSFRSEPDGAHTRFHVEAKGFSHHGQGFRPETAVQDFLIRNGLDR